MTLERDLEAKDRKDAKANGWFVEKIMRTGRDGYPDRHYARADLCPHCGRGRSIHIEWKKPGGRLSKIQEVRIAEMRAAGLEVHVVDNLADARRIRGDL